MPKVAKPTPFMPVDEVAWGTLKEMAEARFSEVAGSKRRRIVFPVPLACASSPGAACNFKEYPKGLLLLGGHAFLFAWYLATYKAIDQEDIDRIRLLVECARTITVTWYGASFDMAALAAESMRLSEVIRVASNVMVDTFVTFADKTAIFFGGSGAQVILAACGCSSALIRVVGAVGGAFQREDGHRGMAE